MDLEQTIKDKMKELGVKKVYTTSVHNILAHSYSFYFLAFLFGIVLDFIFPIQYFDFHSILSLGIILLTIGSFLIFWAQKTSGKLKKGEVHHYHFLIGPYKFSRRPTHLGLFLLILGYGITANSFWIIMFSFISLIVTKYSFLKKEEKFLEKKYGEHYSKYKNIVK